MYDFTKFTVAQLRNELKRRGLDEKGKKADLLERLQANENENQSSKTSEEPVESGSNNVENGDEGEDENNEDENIEENAEENVENENAEKEDKAEGEEAENENDEKVDGDENQDQAELLESGDFVMVDEANDDDEQNELDEDEMMGLSNDEDEKDDKGGVEIEIEAEDDNLGGDEDQKAEGDKKDGKSDKKGDSKVKSEDKSNSEKKETTEEKKENPEDEIKVLTEEEIVELEKVAEVKAAAEKRKEMKRYMFHAYKSTVMSQLDVSLLRKTVVLAPFKPRYLIECEELKEFLVTARAVDMHAKKEGDKGWLELRYKLNRDASEAKEKLTGKIEGVAVDFLEMKHWRNTVSYFEKKITRSQEFMDKYRECMLLAIMEIPAEEVDNITNQDIEDELYPVFTTAMSVTVPDVSNDVTNELRFILVEYNNREKARKAEDDIKEKEISVRGIKLVFKNYQSQWLEAKLHINEKPVGLEIEERSKDLLKEEERYGLGRKIRSIYKTMQGLKKGEDDRRIDVLSLERNRLREQLRIDDRRRSEKGLPRLPWVPEKKKEEGKSPKRSDSVGKSEERKVDRKRSLEKSQSRDRHSQKRTRHDSPGRSRRDDSRGRHRQPSPKYSRGGRSTSGGRPHNGGPRSNYRGGKGGQQGRSLMGMPPGGDRQNYNNQRGILQSPPNIMDSRSMMGGNMMGMNQGNMMGNQVMYGRQGNMMGQGQGMMGAGPVQGGMMGSNQMMGGAGILNTPTSEAGSGSNPVQLLLGLSKVLSNQIKQMQTPETSSQSDSYNDRYRDQSRGGRQDNSSSQGHRGGNDSYRGGSNNDSYGRGGYGSSTAYY